MSLDIGELIGTMERWMLVYEREYELLNVSVGEWILFVIE